MIDLKYKIEEFIEYCHLLKGDEKGEAQVFLDRLFQAFGHAGYKEAGATLEYRVKNKKKHTSFADLLWQPRLLLEMKKRGENLQKHYHQVRDYWHDTYPKPRYVILCNFDLFCIYDFYNQSEPVDQIKLIDLPKRYSALNFLFPIEKKPIFNNDKVSVSRAAADKVATVFNSMIKRKIDRTCAQRFILQCIFSMFAEDFELLPRTLFTELINECYEGASSYDLFGALFNQMNNPKRAQGGRLLQVDYFNGGLFAIIEPIDLIHEELTLLQEAASEDWSKVQPHIFGSLFEGSMNKEERHALGAHFTNEADIKKIVRPIIERPWKELIEKAKTLQKLKMLREELLAFHVLDPACGCGNFLYIAFREMKRIEMILLEKVHANFGVKARKDIGFRSLISLYQFHGIDINPFAVELAKVTLILAKEQSIRETQELSKKGDQLDFAFALDPELPLENLDNNIRCDDALFCEWPKANAIIGNPPYQSKNKIQQELGVAYINKVRHRYPDVPGRADYCVYWFHRAHDELLPGNSAGLVGTNTIRQNYSREGGLDYITANDGTIIEAVSSQPWSGEAVVHVSIVNWIKGQHSGKKALILEVGTKGHTTYEKYELDNINSALSPQIDITLAKKLLKNTQPKCCYQGQTHGHEGFLLSIAEMEEMVLKNNLNRDIIFPYLIADELFRIIPPSPQRFVIDFHPLDVLSAGKYKQPFERVKHLVLPTRQEAANKEADRNKEAIKNNPNARLNHHHENFLKKWWLLSYPREELINKLSKISRYIVCAQLTKRPIFEFISSNIRPNAALIVFLFADDYSFGILQSKFHWLWFKERCSTLKEDYRYTSKSIFESFPWPQSPNIKDIEAIANRSIELRKFRNQIMEQNRWSLRELYRTLESPGINPLRNFHEALDKAVREAYGMDKKEDPLNFLLELNLELAKKESKGEIINGPGLPSHLKSIEHFITTDCVKIEKCNYHNDNFN